jgi:Protein of unknown function (DUF1488)
MAMFSKTSPVSSYDKGGGQMDLHFANPSRSHDPTRRAVRFWAYDRSMEVSFFVAEDALRRLQPSMAAGDNGFLEAFDAHRQRIYEVAAKVFARGPKGSYELQANDF